MNNTPLVSILLATYNRPQFVGQAIQSALDQTLADFELLVVCDSDSDGTRNAVRPFAEKDTRVLYHEIPRMGRIAPVSNYALIQARGEYVAILDDDDTWADRDKLAKQVQFLCGHPDVVGCGGGYITVDAAGHETGRFFKPENDAEIRRHALEANPMANATTMFRRSTAEAVGRYDGTMKEFADWDFWLKMGLQGNLYNFPEYFMHYRMWPQGSSFAKQRGAAESALRIVRRYAHAYPNRTRAFINVYAYNIYARLPASLKRFLNGPMSRLKKTIYARSA